MGVQVRRIHGYVAGQAFGAGTDWIGLLFKPDCSSASAYLSPPRIAYMAISALSGGLTLPLIYFSPLEIYRRIRAARTAEPISA